MAAFTEVPVGITIENIGSLSKGIDGSDQYLMMTRMDDDLTPDDAYEIMMRLAWRDCHVPGGYFCKTGEVMQAFDGKNKVICVLHHRYDV